jgi:hypothetical protein
MPFMWSMGTIIGPVIGGTLARPAIYYPSIFASDGLFGRFPYLLPNLVCAALILVAMIQGYCFLEETHPDLQQHKEEEEEDEEVEDDYIIPDERQRLWVRSGSISSTTGPGFDLRRGSYGTLQHVKVLYPAPSTKSHRHGARPHSTTQSLHPPCSHVHPCPRHFLLPPNDLRPPPPHLPSRRTLLLRLM